MPNIDAMVQEGIAAIKAGRKGDAKAVLMKAVELDEQNEQAWLWLSACVDTTGEQQICLENVLAINPANEKARKGLAAITKKITGEMPAAPAAQPSAAEELDSYNVSFDDDKPFEGTGFDANPYATAANDPVPDSGWGTFDVGDADDSFASPLATDSMSRNEPNAAPPAAYGSGQNVQMPSADEYDNWVSGLSLGDATTGSSSNAGNYDDSNFSEPVYSDPGFPPASDAFTTSDFSFATEKDSFAPSGIGPFDEPLDDRNGGRSNFDSAPSAPAGKMDPMLDFSSGTPPKSGAFTVTDFDALYTDAPAAKENNPFGGSKSDLFGTPNFSTPGNSSFGDDLPAAKAPPSTGSFLFIDPDAPPPLTDQSYFRAIPPEIQAEGIASAPPDTRLMLTVGILAALNILSLAFLLVNAIKH